MQYTHSIHTHTSFIIMINHKLNGFDGFSKILNHFTDEIRLN